MQRSSRALIFARRATKPPAGTLRDESPAVGRRLGRLFRSSHHSHHSRARDSRKMNQVLQWYEKQQPSIKAAVIAGLAPLIGVFISGCFMIIAALISRPATPKPVILPTFLPTFQPSLATVSPPVPSPAATTSGQAPATKPVGDLFIRSLETFTNSLPPLLRSVILGTVGLAIIVIALVSAIRAAGGNRAVPLAFAVILELYFFTRWLGWWGLLATYLAATLTILLSDPEFSEGSRVSGFLVGASSGGMLGIGASLFYLAFVGPFVSVYLLAGLIVFGTIGAVVGLIFGNPE